MVRKLYFILACCLMALAVSSCVKEMYVPGPPVETAGDNSIVIDIGKGLEPSTRAEAIGAEKLVEHLDVLIFEESGAFAWHERAILSDGDGSGKITLGARRDSFTANASYWVYLVANSTHASADFDNIDLNGLRSMTESTRMIFLTGGTNQNAPKSFLMDGLAYPASSAASSSSPVVLNDGVLSNDTELKVELRRAAAKIVVNINKGEKITFKGSTAAGYYVNNMPYTTSVISGIGAPASLRTPQRYGGEDFFKWAEQTITVTSYTYAHDWSGASSFENEVRLVVNIPMIYTDDNGTETEFENSYYQIPVSKDRILKRNTYYEVNVTVDAPGATDPSEPVQLDSISYVVLDWTKTTINIGGDDEKPAYLALNRYELEMDNIEDDNTSISFASSSDVSIKVDSVYYFDKFGQLKTVTDHGVTLSALGDLNGTIAIHSPLPMNNTVRYIEFTVSNTQGLSQQVKVMQYPLEYITNIQSWYSYRSDFGAVEYGVQTETSYEKLNGEDVNGKEYDKRIRQRYCGVTWSNGWTYRNSPTGAFFGSKVVASENSDGTSVIHFYQWSEQTHGFIFNWTYSYNISSFPNSSIEALDNAKMYHVKITSTSDQYVLGIPRLNSDGLTDGGADNAKLVSPSFMIASQLGAVLAAGTVEIAGSHCKEYVEVYKDSDTGEVVHLDDWRLPTEAELKIIMKFQYAENAAMDEVLSGSRYWSASGLVTNEHVTYNPNDSAIRCIRDVYGD